MQSSSELFPVSLMSAELRGDLSEDVYLLKPNNSPDSSVELALTRLGRAGAEGERGVPVVLLHGSFSNRRFWYSPKGIGLGPYLARAGFDVWIAEMRGHGLSPRNENYRDNHVAQYVRYDLPAIADFIIEQTGQAAHWVGHSLGGVILAAALGAVISTSRGRVRRHCSAARSAGSIGRSSCRLWSGAVACCCVPSPTCPGVG